MRVVNSLSSYSFQLKECHLVLCVMILLDFERMTGAHTTAQDPHDPFQFHNDWGSLGATCVASFAGLLKLFRRFSYLKEFLSTVGEPGEVVLRFHPLLKRYGKGLRRSVFVLQQRQEQSDRSKTESHDNLS